MDEFFKIIETEYILMPTWKWVCLVLVVLLFPFLRRAMSLIVIKLKSSSFLLHSKNIYIAEISKTNLEGPLSAILTLILFIFVIDVIDFSKNINKYTILVAQVLIGIRWIQLLIMCVDAVSASWSQKFIGEQGPNEIIPFAVKTAKVVLVILGLLLTLQSLGVNVISLLAGLGIGGLAIALAGQETIANLFGSLTILIDKPFKIHDTIKVMDVEGTVVEIGFRSTRIQTVTNTIVNIPNSTLAKEKLENLSARYKRRIRHTITLAYETPTTSIQVFIDKIRSYIKANELVDQDDITVSLFALNAYSVDILVNFHIRVLDIKSELEIQQGFLFYVLSTANDMKIELAYPTQTSIVRTSPPVVS